MRTWSQALLLSLLLIPMLYAADWTTVLEGSRFSPTEQASLGGLILSAVNAGLPEELLVDRLKEGIAKKAGFDRLRMVIIREIASLRQAQEILEKAFARKLTDTDLAYLQRTALLIRSELSIQQVETLIKAYRTRWNDYLLAITALFSLHDWGLSWSDSLLLIEEMAQSAIQAKDFPALVGILAEARRQQIRPGEILERLVEAAAKSPSIAALKHKVLP